MKHGADDAIMIETDSEASRAANPDNAPGRPLIATQEPQKSAIRSNGMERLVFDRAAFGRTSAFLAPEAVTAILRTMSGRGKDLSRRLEGFEKNLGELAGAAHGLAGSGAMFGFNRLSATCLSFEHAVETEAPDLIDLTDALREALDATLREIQGLMDSASIEPAPEAEEARKAAV
jgi:HPt (histidine-containing phosphotransfer) domain-containing protein